MPRVKKNLHEEELEDVVAESLEEPEVKEEEPVVEEKKEEPPETHEDVEALKAEIQALKDEVKSAPEKMNQEMVEKLSTAFGITKSEDPADQTPWDREGRTPTWKEALDYTAEQTHSKIKSDMEAEENKEKEAEQAQAKTQEDFNANINKYWDSQIDELTEAGRIPPIKDPNNKEDLGKQFRVELFKTMTEVNQEREKRGLAAISNLKEVYYEHFKAPNQQPAGYNAPIAGSNPTGSATKEKSSYSEFHKESIEDIFNNS